MLHTSRCPADAIQTIATWTPRRAPGPLHAHLLLDRHPDFGYLVHYAIRVRAQDHPREVEQARDASRLLRQGQDGLCCITVGIAARLPTPDHRGPAGEPVSPYCSDPSRPYDWDGVAEQWHQVLDSIPLRELASDERAREARQVQLTPG